MKPRWIGRVRKLSKLSKLSGYTEVIDRLWVYNTYTRYAPIMMSVKFRDVL